MIEIKQYKIEEDKEGKYQFKIDAKVDKDFNTHIYYLVNKYQRSYVRSGNSSAKTRSEVKGTTAKPFKQKGTGNARRGTKKSPLLVGGGVIFPPKNRDYKIKLNSKIFKKCYKQLLAEEVNKIILLDSTQDTQIKTKQINKVLSNVNKDHSSKKSKYVFILNTENVNIFKACRNIPNVKVFSPNFISCLSKEFGLIFV